MVNRACLLLHGFTGGPYEVLPLADELTKEGWICRVPTLPGHGGDPARLGTVEWRDWVLAAEQEADALMQEFGQLDLVGFSMGGMIAARVAAKYPVRRVVFLNAAYVYLSPRRFVSELMFRSRAEEPTNPGSLKMRGTPWKAALQFMKLVRQMKRELTSVKQPALVIQGLRDPVVHPVSAKLLARQLQGEVKVRYYPLSKHLICLGEEAGQVIEEVKRFLTEA